MHCKLYCIANINNTAHNYTVQIGLHTVAIINNNTHNFALLIILHS